jgi:DMSO reductase family type II enzyme heme b subunit
MAAYYDNSVLILLTVILLVAPGCRPKTQAPLTHVIAVSSAEVPNDPSDPAWDQAPEYVAQLMLQDLVEPRLMTPSTPNLRVRAVAAEDQLAFRLEWADDSENLTAASAVFPDACAIQFPSKPEPTVPAPQMGEVGRGVELSYWNAAWQAIVDGAEPWNELRPAAVDHYPFEAKSLEKDPEAKQAMQTRYAPAQALGNYMTGPRESAVEDLIAEGPGTLRRGPESKSKGRGQHTGSGWTVVISRPKPACFSEDVPAQVAFAVWRGDQQEIGAKKMRTGWIMLSVQDHP